eukprot:TRINITY_DN1057_c0_g1::TRINITY_DN1057_c0_g1_i1::g.30026::m.30026 TRINITY_DN1057_c0_g1::TRINITY_DN1057_c0_g1_i1::g.30026  ORF type:complete len:115 (-),score=-5.97,SCA7/PF08313.7/0.21,DUF3380/PF11860.3/0.24 TRINITY_DN1057_c0_g1_i1:1327-1671(-)
MVHRALHLVCAARRDPFLGHDGVFLPLVGIPCARDLFCGSHYSSLAYASVQERLGPFTDDAQPMDPFDSFDCAERDLHETFRGQHWREASGSVSDFPLALCARGGEPRPCIPHH